MFGVEAQVIKPPRVGFVEPLEQRAILELLARDVSVVEEHVEIVFAELFGVVLEQGERFGERPEHRIVGGDAHFPTLQMNADLAFASEGQRDRSKLQSPQHTELKCQPTVCKLHTLSRE